MISKLFAFRDDTLTLRSSSAPDAVNRNPGGSPVTVFIDGPTGFVFVYTAEGWKFVRSMGAGKL